MLKPLKKNTLEKTFFYEFLTEIFNQLYSKVDLVYEKMKKIRFEIRKIIYKIKYLKKSYKCK